MNLSVDLQLSSKIVRFLEEAKAQSERVLDSLPGIFAVIDINGIVFRGNAKLAEFLNVEFEGLAGQNFDNLIAPDHRDEFLEKLMKATDFVDTGINFELNLLDKNKNLTNFIINIRPFTNPDYGATELELFVLVGNDVTDVKKISEKMSRMEVELQTAKAVQDTLFPEPAEYATAKLSLAGTYQPASECGGDWWFYNKIGNRIFLWIGDVTGHGVSAALVTSAARASVSGMESNPNMTPSLAMSILNKAVFDASKGQKYMSFFIISIDMGTGECSYSSAAHDLPFVIRPNEVDPAKGMVVSYLPTSETSFLLGQKEDATFPESHVKIKPGERIFLYTDGVTELANEQGQQWGDRRVRQAVQKCAEEFRDSSKFIFKLNEKINEFRGQAELLDDMTFFVFSFLNYDSNPPKFKTQQTVIGS